MRLRGELHLIGRALGLLLGLVSGLVAGEVIHLAGVAVVEGPHVPREELGDLLREAVAETTVAHATALLLGAAAGVVTAKAVWRFPGLLALTGLSSIVAGFFAYAVGITLPQVDERVSVLSLALLVAEAASLGMVVVYAYYGLDVVARRRWRRVPERAPFSPFYVPKVAFHVACFNEPPSLVRASLDALQRLDYPRDRVVVMVLDDSTREECSAPLEAYCRERGIAYLHRDDRRGYKAGALNDALPRTPADVELVSVLDADYQLDPSFLKETVGYFVDPNLGFLQTPQDYRNVEQSFLTRGYYHADAYFYRAVLPSRNEANTIIFCGTMGIIRRSTLEAVGGWGEAFITEDSELSVRVLEHGYDSLYVNRTYGRGLIPPTFDAYKKQLYRWSFGSVKVVKAHLRRFLFSRLSVRQKLDFLLGNLHWFDGVFVLAIAAILATVAAGSLVGVDLGNHHEREMWLLGLVPFALLVDGVVRLHAALTRATGAGFLGSLRVLGMWYAIKFNNMFAALKSLVGFRLPFVRTPKAPERRPTRVEAFGLALRLAPFELACGLALLLLAAATAWNEALDAGTRGHVSTAAVLLSVWLAVYALMFLAAPYYAYRSFATFVPEEEMERRDEKRRNLARKA